MENRREMLARSPLLPLLIKLSVPAMLTGDVYKKDTKYTEYVSRAWNNYNVFDVLQKNDCDARVYSDGTVVYDDYEPDYIIVDGVRIYSDGSIGF